MSAKRILIVDDEAELLELVKMRLEAHQYEVLTAASGTSGLECALKERPDLILLDVMMPGMDGNEVLRRLRHDERTRSIPVIMLTAKGDTRSILNAQSLWATDYFIKPFEASELLACIRKYL